MHPIAIDGLFSLTVIKLIILSQHNKVLGVTLNKFKLNSFVSLHYTPNINENVLFWFWQQR